MALENKLRVSELAQSGSRAIISEDPISKTHTFIDGSTTIVSKSASEPYEHIEGERDGELTNFIEKPKYDEEQLKKAVDTVIDELIVPPPRPTPDVVPKALYDDLLEKYNKAVADLAEANNTIRDLQAQISQLQGQIQSLRSQLDAAQVARAIAENQLQQQASSFGDLSAKFSQAIIKGTRETAARVSLQAQVEGLTAQKDTLREQILQLRQIVASLQGQVAAQLDILDIQTQAAKDAQAAAEKAAEDAANAAAAELAAANQTNLRDLLSTFLPNTWQVSGTIGYLVNHSRGKFAHTEKTDGGSNWQFYFDDRRNHWRGIICGRKITFYNIAEESVKLTKKTQTLNGDGDGSTLPTSITIPAATKDTTGQLQPGSKALILRRRSGRGKGTDDAKITYSTPKNEKLILYTHYWQCYGDQKVSDNHGYTSSNSIQSNENQVVQNL
jgi:predicted  nucleic acid-binding Zn-ribbon protein